MRVLLVVLVLFIASLAIVITIVDDVRWEKHYLGSLGVRR